MEQAPMQQVVIRIRNDNPTSLGVSTVLAPGDCVVLEGVAPDESDLQIVATITILQILVGAIQVHVTLSNSDDQDMYLLANDGLTIVYNGRAFATLSWCPPAPEGH